jgi:hypothetical protein
MKNPVLHDNLMRPQKKLLSAASYFCIVKLLAIPIYLRMMY